jgi:glycosyltransferase involved in cell wall biosynthesis
MPTSVTSALRQQHRHVEERPVMRPKLAIAIPTYQRPGEIGLNDDIFMQECAALGIVIYVSDDSNDDDTARLAEAAAKKYGNVFYRKNVPACGHDRNIIETLSWPDADYVWIIGDTFSAMPGTLKPLMHSLQGQDFQFVNWNSGDLRVTEIVSGAEAVDLVRDKLWHQTLTGGTIYHFRVRDWVRSNLPEIHHNFPHIDVILGYLSQYASSVRWYGKKVLISAPKKSSYWHHKALDVFVDDWFSVLNAYPTILSPAQAIEIGKAHSANTGLFDVMFLVRLRAIGHLTWSSAKKEHFWHAMHVNKSRILLILLAPKAALVAAAPVKRRLSRLLRR